MRESLAISEQEAAIQKAEKLAEHLSWRIVFLCNHAAMNVKLKSGGAEATRVFLSLLESFHRAGQRDASPYGDNDERS